MRRLIVSAIFIAIPTAFQAAHSAAGAETLYGVTTPALRKRAEVEAVLAEAPKLQVEAAI